MRQTKSPLLASGATDSFLPISPLTLSGAGEMDLQEPASVEDVLQVDAIAREVKPENK